MALQQKYSVFYAVRVEMLWTGPAAIVNDRPILSLDICYVVTMTARIQLKKIAGRESQGAWRQHKLIDGKSPVVK
jgi:hypothetical protein